MDPPWGSITYTIGMLSRIVGSVDPPRALGRKPQRGGGLRTAPCAGDPYIGDYWGPFGSFQKFGGPNKDTKL